MITKYIRIAGETIKRAAKEGVAEGIDEARMNTTVVCPVCGGKGYLAKNAKKPDLSAFSFVSTSQIEIPKPAFGKDTCYRCGGSGRMRL